MTTKPTNPKDIIGIRKAPMSTVSAAVMAEVGVAMLEGACKYGRHNYRAVGVRSSVYYDATMRHVMDWWEGVDIDPDSGMHHITKAITSLVVLRDAMIQDKCCDDRPPRSANFYDALNVKAGEIMDKYADRDPIHYTEAYMQQQKAGWTDETIKAASFAHGGPISPGAVYRAGEQSLPCNSPVRGIYVDPYDEPAASIDDDSARMQAIGQNGNTGEHYDSAPSWDDAPEWAAWLAQDKFGSWLWFECPIEPIEADGEWYEQKGFDGRIKLIGGSVKNPSWRNTLQARPTKEAI